MSSSSLGRLTPRLQKELQEYNLELLTGPFRIEGNEKTIRHFYSVYFRERSSVLDWPFPEIDRKLVKNILDAVIARYRLNSAILDTRYFELLIAVNIIREKQGYSILDKNDLLYLEKTLKKDSYYEEIHYWDILFSIHLQNNHHNSLIFQEEIEEIQKVLLFISNVFHIPLPDTSHLIFILNNLLRFYSIQPKEIEGKKHILFELRDTFLLQYYQTNFTFFYEVSEEKLMNLCIKRGITIDENVNHSIMQAFLSKWDKLTEYLINNYNTCNVLIYSHYNQTHAHKIKEELRFKLATSVDFSIYSFSEITEEKLNELNFDILLTTTTLFLNIEKPIIYLHRNGLDLDLTTLKKEIEKKYALVNCITEKKFKRDCLSMKLLLKIKRPIII